MVEGPLSTTHHNASAQVFAEPDGRARFVWITDVLPHEAGETVEQMMEHGIGVIRATLETAAAAAGAA